MEYYGYTNSIPAEDKSMLTKTVKTAISMPREDFSLVEAVRKRLHRTRSEILLEAFRAWVKQGKVEELERNYAEGYASHPEKLADIEAFMAAGLAAWES